MKVSRGRVDSFVAAPDAGIAAVLVYGPDRGLAREYVDKLTAAIVDDPADPFRVAVLTAAELKGEPGRLGDEAAALALTGGRRVVVVRADGDVTQAATDYLDRVAGDADGGALVVIEAGDLNPRSALRKAFEGAKHAAAIACYADRAEDLARLVDSVMKEHKVRLDGEARRFVVANLGGDRLASRAELEKLALYVGEGGEAGLAEVVAVIGDGAQLDLDEVVLAAAGGDMAALDAQLARAFTGGTEPVSVLRAAQRHFQRLHLAAAAVAGGANPETAMKGLRPPVMFLHADRFRAQIARWPADKISTAMELLVEAELDCKSGGVPPEPACGRALMRIAQAASR